MFDFSAVTSVKLNMFLNICSVNSVLLKCVLAVWVGVKQQGQSWLQSKDLGEKKCSLCGAGTSIDGVAAVGVIRTNLQKKSQDSILI